MGRKIVKYEWEWKGNKYKVEESLNHKINPNSIYPIVWFEGKLYNAFIKPESPPRIDRVCLLDLYYPDKKPYWTTTDKVFQIIKQ